MPQICKCLLLLAASKSFRSASLILDSLYKPLSLPKRQHGLLPRSVFYILVWPCLFLANVVKPENAIASTDVTICPDDGREGEEGEVRVEDGIVRPFSLVRVVGEKWVFQKRGHGAEVGHLQKSGYNVRGIAVEDHVAWGENENVVVPLIG